MSIGVVVSSLALKPLSVIWFAQVANGILLPIITLCSLLAVNAPNLGQYRHNLLGLAVFAVTLMLSGRPLYLAFN
ncbi:hypothetical protein GCM10010919_21080 [Alishewanella longhuensis]|uniref:Uncharacterized protein n=1 Tax=Alishewanella longhuensis TaxID=1091037 RepID=A0ABQ3KZZ8_9ALTE|nr:hypothetical protein [Alishewanella longhuensis]GHG70429.1 hypothetical protein GCM10010919_21080 [Alishewanella longhuensis]